MRSVLTFLFLFLLAGFQGFAQEDSILNRIVLVGDAGQLTDGRQPVVSSIQKHIPLDKKTTVLYLGDNLYKTGLPDNSLPTYDIAKAPLDSQINIAKGKDAMVYFVPGNHDWANGASVGWESILRVQSYIDLLGNNKVKQLPRDGCPGPEAVDINDSVMVIFMDSQWWLMEYDKPGIESSCDTKTKSEIIAELDELLSDNSDKLILLAIHHPLKSYGPHGGYFTLKQHIFPFTDINEKWYFPLPVLGSAYPLTRAVFGTIQDIKHPLYQEMIQQFERTVKPYKNVIYVSGHEHTLQLIQDSGRNYIVSGSGSKSNRVSKGPGTQFSTSDNGYAVMNITHNRKVYLDFYTVDGDSTTKRYSNQILDFTRQKAEPEDTTKREPDFVYKDTVWISASDKFKNWTGFKRKVLGDNYSKEWNEPVAMKVFNINKAKGGLIIKSMGGGKQTKSLKMEDANGKEFTLRMIEKDPEKAVPENLRNSIAHNIVADMISASHPYGSMPAQKLAKDIGILAEVPELYFVPDDPALGKYRPIFGNTVCVLEDRDPTPDGSDAKSTTNIINKMIEDNKSTVDQQAVLKARLFDMLIGDWDRHQDQWKWGKLDTGQKGNKYYPIPRDRDQAFFKSNGLLIKAATLNGLSYMKGFNKKLGDIEDLNWVARNFDRQFLNRIDEGTWKGVSEDFIESLPDSVIRNSMTAFPEEIRKMDSAMIAEKLLTRRDDLARKSLAYYKFISREVDVMGSNEKELFHVQRSEDYNKNGYIKVSVYKKTAQKDSSGLLFQREFDPKVTKEIRLYGLNENDDFIVDPNVDSKIKLRIIGGKGVDTFNLQGKIKKEVYDLSQEKNMFLNNDATDKHLSTDIGILKVDNNNYNYNSTVFPRINLGFNNDDGVLLGLGISRRTYGFRKYPYASDQKLSTLVSPRFSAWQVKYNGVFNNTIFDNDLLINASAIHPTLNNFFGFGNSTPHDKDKPREYYLARYNDIRAEVLIRKRFTDFLSFSAGPAFMYYSNKERFNKDRILQNPHLWNMDSASLYANKYYGGGKLNLDIDYINNERIPTRGITWYTELSALKGLNDLANDLVKLKSDVTVYATISDRSRVTTILRAGGGKIFTDNPEFFQAMTLGAENHNRGYRKNRFTGNSSLYGSSELRFRLFKSNSFLLPGDVGLVGFYDIGRVWVPKEGSKQWHSSYGGGLYFQPFDLLFISGLVGFSKEDVLFNLSVGTKFNITF